MWLCVELTPGSWFSTLHTFLLNPYQPYEVGTITSPFDT